MIPVSVRGLSVTSRGGAVFRDLDLEVPAGSAIALVGPSGSGKSTLAHALLGDVPDGLTVTAGTITVDGLDPLVMSPRQLRTLRRRCAYVDQDPGASLPPHLTVRRILGERARIAHGSPSRGGRAPVLSDDAMLGLLEDLGLSGVTGILDRRPSELSGGQRRRVGVAAGLAAAPELLIIDEPTAGVDAAAVELMMDTLCRARERTKATYLVITHDHVVADALADVTFAFDDACAGLSGPKTANPALDHDEAAEPVSAVLGPADPGIASAAPPAPEPVPTPDSGAAQHPLLDVRDLVIHRNGSRIVEGVSLAVGAGGAVALSGPSGAGKTTVLRSILGLAPATEGRISFDGSDLAPDLRHRPRHVRSGFGWVPQESELSLNPSVAVGSQLRRTGAPDDDIAAMLDRLQLPDFHAIRRSRPGDLSGGQRQRVSIALSLLRNPRVLLCDEPTSALDHRSAELVLSALADARAGGMAQVLTSHDPRVLAAAAETVVIGAGQAVAGA